MRMNIAEHYDKLIEEGNDPFFDPLPLQEYMDKWDGKKFIDSMQLSERKSVLEIGIGTGRIAARVAPHCRRLLGIDISPKTVERARENLFDFQNVELVCADFSEYAFSETFE